MNFIAQPALPHFSWVYTSLSPSICPSGSPQHPRGLVCSVEDAVTGLPSLWLSLLAPQGEGPPMQTVSAFHVPFRAGGPNLTPFLPSYQYVIFLKASIVNSASSQLVFHESCSVCGFLMCLCGNVSSILLLHHLDLNPENRFFQNFFTLGLKMFQSSFIWQRRQWHPTPVLLSGESQGQRSLVGRHLWGHTESDTTEVT